jgi:hypothetical protein
MTWTPLETNTHQDHVIAHVIDATPLGHFIWDETAYVLLDIGFIWNIYLDMQMGLAPLPVTIAELEAEDAVKSELRTDVDLLLQGKTENLARMRSIKEPSPIFKVELSESQNVRRLDLVCEEHTIVIEASLNTGAVVIY